MEKDINGNRNTLNNYSFIDCIGAIYNLVLWNGSGVNKDSLCTLYFARPYYIWKCVSIEDTKMSRSSNSIKM